MAGSLLNIGETPADGILAPPNRGSGKTHNNLASACETPFSSTDGPRPAAFQGAQKSLCATLQRMNE
jgi:hypothetical protein